MTIGERIAKYRREKGLTQEGLAKLLDVTNQAVSKWESDQCCPDIGLLPRLADVFEISVDALFGRETVQPRKVEGLPWANDSTLRVVVYHGHRLLKNSNGERELVFRYEGPALNIDSAVNVDCGDVSGNVDAGAMVNCGAVGGNVDAGGMVNCGAVGGDVDAGGSVNCGAVGGSVDAAGNVDCGVVGGDVDAGGNVTSQDVGGSVDAGSSVTCGNVGGDVDAGTDVNCAAVEGDVDAGGNVRIG